MFTHRVARCASRRQGFGSHPHGDAARRWAVAALAGSCMALNGASATLALSAVGLVAAGALAQCGTASITQSTSPDVIQAARAAWCGTLAFNDLTQIGRGFVAPYDLTVGCVRFGVTRNTGADWPCIVRIRLGTLADPYDSHAVLGERTVTIPAGTTSEFFTADFGTVYLPAGTAFVVELETPSRNPDEGGDGALLSLGFNALGQSGPTMLRSEPCGVPQFTDLASIGFPNSHAAISIGVSEGRDLPVFGGFPISPTGTVAMGTHDGFTSAYGDGSGATVGLSVDLGQTSMGAGASFRAIATGDEPDPMVEIVFRSATGQDRIRIRNHDGSNERATIDLDFDTPHFDRFDFEVYLEGELVGVLEDQESGSVILSDPGDFWKWLKDLLGIKGKAGCEIRKEYYPASEGGGLKSEYMFYGIEVTSSRFAASNPGLPPLIGDSFAIVPRVPVLPDSPPVAVDVLVSGITGVGVDVAEGSPTILFGSDETKPQDVKKEKPKTRKGTSGTIFRPSVGEWRQTSPTQLSGDDVDGDGIPDLVVRPGSPVPGEPDASVLLDFGGVFSAGVGLEVVSPEPFAACMTVCAFEVGLPPIPSGKTQFDPWPGVPDFIAIVPDFTGVGSGQYTIEVYDQAGTLVYAESGQSGLAGGTSQWARDIGKIGGRTPCYRIKFPRDTVFRTADGRHFDTAEIRLLAEGAADAGPIDSLIIDVMGMERLHLLGPTTVLTDPAERCYGDFDSDGALTIFDFLAYQNAFSLGRASADCDEDGALTIFDFLCFQNAFAIGCP
ncbi:MAG: hypothetical protein KIT54_02580 [Phycisphaeraceae bacterium]|nr:hypothetical protein [Phycisphaeraceae bacterium]